ncbi:response regulator [Epidermidibacterium keratini]|uniref:Response regulator n=1 Tax=Epidermidibacterium keratini TaxID=1891644 RepID=A0A7L4YPF8_9ACTN|nr:response regulator transcription factor [Epidermidibacterium keratini]QHC01036.1 response regulator [Epidermidibacterium keratini]
MSHILIAEDAERISSFIEKGLRSAGYLTTVADNGETALLLARTGAFDLVVLDIGLPRLSGFEVLQRLRDEGHEVPVIVLTARDTVGDTVAGLEGGANDYMTKPFEFAELLARIKLRIRDVETTGSESEGLEAAGLHLDVRSRRVSGDGVLADLTSREYAVLELLMRNPGQLLSRDQILDRVWGFDHDPSSNVVEVFIRALRRKIGEHRIETVRGLGYRLRDQRETS